MKSLPCAFLLSCFTLATWAQAQVPDLNPEQQPADQRVEPKPEQPQEAPNEAQRSVLEVKPGQEVIKDKDLWEKTGYFHPFGRMPKYILHDQKALWTSPFHTAKSDIKWWVIFGTATGALIATDKYTSKNAPDNATVRRVGADTSYLGAAYTLIPIASGFYFIGTAKHSERFRETGLLCFETLIDTTLMELVIKAATDRARPLESDGRGRFWDSSGGPWNASFPSGHAINTFGVASIFAHQYRDKWWVQAIAYGYAAGVVGARLAAKRHFPGDVVAGGAMGWFIGDYVYGKRHNSELDHKPTITQKILDHVRLGASFN